MSEKSIELINAAIDGDKTALLELKEVSPQAFELALDKYSDLGRETQRVLIEAIYLQRWGSKEDGDHLAVASVERQAENLRHALCELHVSPLERLMVDRVICCWIAANHADRESADWPGNRLDDKVQKFVDRCHKRFSMACKDLATVHKLLGPSVQINVAQNQQVANIFQ